MSRRAMKPRFKRNDHFQCSCYSGRCPNYDPIACGKGGAVVYVECGTAFNISRLKKLLLTDVNLSDRFAEP